MIWLKNKLNYKGHRMKFLNKQCKEEKRQNNNQLNNQKGYQKLK